MCPQCHLHCSAIVGGDDAYHPRDREGSGQTAGMLHMHQCICHIQRGDRPSGEKACVASVTGDSTVHTFPQQDLVRRTVEG